MIYAKDAKLALFAISMFIITAVIFVPYPCLVARNLQLTAIAGWVIVAGYQIWFTSSDEVKPATKEDEKHD